MTGFTGTVSVISSDPTDLRFVDNFLLLTLVQRVIQKENVSYKRNMMRSLLTVALLLLGSTLWAVEPVTDTPTGASLTDWEDTDWPQYLGRRRDGVSQETGLNLDWDSHPPAILWRTPIGGGYSSLATHRGRVYATGEQDGQILGFCFEAHTGELLWQQKVGDPYLDQQQQGSGPRATPTYQNGQVFFLGPSADLVCVRADNGATLWHTNIYAACGIEDPAAEDQYWGLSTSPLVEGNLVICQPGGNHENHLAAFDRRNGKLVWSADNDHRSYASPISTSIAGRHQVIAFTGESLLGVNPDNGGILWRFTHRNQYKCNCATPLVINDQIFISTGYGGGSALLQLEREGEKIRVTEKWVQKRYQNLFATSMLVNGYLYGCHGDVGSCTFRCIELVTGELQWVDRQPGRCTCIKVENHIIALSEDGVLRLIDPNPEKYVEKAKLEGILKLKSWAVPALSQKRLFVRDQHDLVCIDLDD